jgi:hypothetical protein
VEDAREALHNSSLLGQRIRVERCKGRKGWEVNAVILPGTPWVFVCVYQSIYCSIWCFLFAKKRLSVYLTSHLPFRFTDVFARTYILYMYTYEYIYIYVCVYEYIYMYRYRYIFLWESQNNMFFGDSYRL